MKPTGNSYNWKCGQEDCYKFNPRNAQEVQSLTELQMQTRLERQLQHNQICEEAERSQQQSKT